MDNTMEDIPEFLRADAAKRKAAWAQYRPAHSTGQTGPAFDWTTYYGPGSTCHRLGYAESDEERATRATWLREKAEHSEQAHEKFIEKRLDQDDADIKEAARRVEYQRKLRELKKTKSKK